MILYSISNTKDVEEPVGAWKAEVVRLDNAVKELKQQKQAVPEVKFIAFRC